MRNHLDARGANGAATAEQPSVSLVHILLDCASLNFSGREIEADTSNLSFGISRVYSQQCGYVLADAENAQHSIRALLKVVRTAELDPEAGRGRHVNASRARLLS